jgi:hypothetical protein
MADNVQVTQGSGTAMATDDIGGVHYPRFKLTVGGDGSANDVSEQYPLPVSMAGGDGLATEATLASMASKVATEQTLSSLSAKVATESTLSKIATEATLSSLSSTLATEATLSKVATEATLASITSTLATEATLAGIASTVATEATLAGITSGLATEATLSSIEAKIPAPLASQPSVARQLAAGSTTANTALTASVRRVSIRAVGADIRYAVGSGSQTASATSHFIAQNERLEIAVPASPNIAVIRNASTDGTLELSELI